MSSGAKTNICFTGSGLMSTYQLGVAQFLYEHFDLQSEDARKSTVYSACSDGCGPAVSLAAGACPEAVLSAFFKHIEAYMAIKVPVLSSVLQYLPKPMRLNHWALAAAAADYTRWMLEEDAPRSMATIDGRVYVMISSIDRKRGIVGHLLNDFTSIDDLCGAVRASISIPSVTCPPIPSVYRGYRCFDGGVVDAAPHIAHYTHQRSRPLRPKAAHALHARSETAKRKRHRNPYALFPDDAVADTCAHNEVQPISEPAAEDVEQLSVGERASEALPSAPSSSSGGDHRSIRVSVDGDYATLIISPIKWRRPRAQWFVLIGDGDHQHSQFRLGYNDAFLHRHELMLYLRPKEKFLNSHVPRPLSAVSPSTAGDHSVRLAITAAVDIPGDAAAMLSSESEVPLYPSPGGSVCSYGVRAPSCRCCANGDTHNAHLFSSTAATSAGAVEFKSRAALISPLSQLSQITRLVLDSVHNSVETVRALVNGKTTQKN